MVRIIVVFSPSLQVCWTTSGPGQSTDQALPAPPLVQVIASLGQAQPGSHPMPIATLHLHHPQDQGNSHINHTSNTFYDVRFGQPSILASSGDLTSDTETASLSVTPVADSGPLPVRSPGYTVTRPDSVVGYPGSGGSGSLTTRISATPWVTVSSSSSGSR